MSVIKRNGREVKFNFSKIKTAVSRAASSCGGSVASSDFKELETHFDSEKKYSVEQIQEIIEAWLMDRGLHRIAKTFILYREEHKKVRLLKERISYMNSYIDSDSNASTASETDVNANVSIKNVSNLEGEVYKVNNRQIQREHMFHELTILYPEVAKQYSTDVEHHIIYPHDESCSPVQKPYTYSPKETAHAIIEGKRLLASLESIYSACDVKSECPEEGVTIKRPKNSYVFDKDGITKIVQITKRKRHRNLVRVKTSFGEDIVVTDNHPMIIGDTKDDTCNAIDSEGKLQTRLSSSISFDGIKSIDLRDILPYDILSNNFICSHQDHMPDWVAKRNIDITRNLGYVINCICSHQNHMPYWVAKRNIDITRNLGYVIGFFISDGNYDNTSHNITFTQKDRMILLKISEHIFDTFGDISSIIQKQDDSKYVLTVHSDFVYDLFRDYFKIKDKAWNKCIPYNILQFNEDFALGVVEGIIDANGTVIDNIISIKLSSRECITQLTMLLQYFGYGVNNSCQIAGFGNNKSYQSGYTTWEIQFANSVGSKKLENSFKFAETSETSSHLKYSVGKAPITSVKEIDNCSFLEQCDYIYDITTESNTFICNNLWVHNCMAASLFPLMLEGVGNVDGVTPGPPNDIKSFSGQITNLIFTLSSQIKGACAVGDYFIVYNYYIIQEFGEDWYNHLDDVISCGPVKKVETVKSRVHEGFKQFVWGINQPAGNRSYQSPFTNVSYYDHTYFNSLFGEFKYPDGTAPKWEAIDTIQRLFMKWFNNVRLKQVLTFPVETLAMVCDPVTNDIIDKDYKNLCAEMYSEGHSFFTYISDSADSLSSCCFSKDMKVIWKSSNLGVRMTTLEELHNTKWGTDKKTLRIFHNGSWVKGKSIKLPNRKMYKVVTANNKEMILTDNHINATYKGDIQTETLTTEDYILFNTSELHAVPENDELLAYSDGFVIGAFLGNGSFGARFDDGTIYETNFSLSESKYYECINNINNNLTNLGEEYKKCSVSTDYNNAYSYRISSRELVAFIQKWTNWTEGTYEFNKELNLNCMIQSADFRRGILAGWYATNGGDSNICYTSSENLKDCMEALITSLGMQSVIDVSDRTGENAIIRKEEYNRDYPLYCVRWYEPANHRANKDSDASWKKKNNCIYFRVKSIEEVEYTDDVYCIECSNPEEPYFTLPSGIITHNCRLRNKVSENTFSPTSGMTGVMTGSCNVITINVNRIVQDWYKEIRSAVTVDYIPDKSEIASRFGDSTSAWTQSLRQYIVNILDRVYKYHIAYKTMLYDMEDKKMFTSSNAGYIFISKLYSTIGINGLNEAARFFGLKVNNNIDYVKFLQFILGTIKEQNALYSIHDKKRPFIFNSEVVPAEGLGVKNYNWDKADGYWVPDDENLYNSYFYDAKDAGTNIFDKFQMHGKDTFQYTDGGSALHCNLDTHLSKEQYLKLIDYAIEHGTSYFTFNVPNTKCNDCGHIVKVPVDECPKCKSKHLTKYTRVVGYMRPITSFGTERQEEAKKRFYSKGKEVYEKEDSHDEIS